MTDPMPDIPKFDSDKPQEDKRERKGLGVPWLSRAGAGASRVGGPGGLAQGGGGLFATGAGGFFSRLGAALMAQPAIMLSLAAGIGLAGLVAWETGVLDALNNSGKKTGIFAKKNAGLQEPGKADLHGGDRNSSLKYVAQPNAGAFNQTDAGAGDGAGSDKGNADAAQDASQDAAAPQADPSSLAEQLAQKNQAGGFGKLSIGKGSLSGGSGMSGGIGRPFSQLSMVPKNSSLQSFAKPAAVGRSTVGKRAVLLSNRKNANLRKLDNMNRAIKPTTGMGNLQQASAVQTEQWTSAQPGGQASAGDGGQGISGGGEVLDDGPGVSEGPINPVEDVSATTPNAPDVSGTKDVTPWTGMVTAAKWMLMLASAIITLMGLIPAWFANVKMVLLGIVAALATAVTVMGIIIMTTYGQTTQGLILTTAGGITAAAAAAAMLWSSMPTWVLILAGIAGLAGSVMSMLTSTKIGPQ